MALTGTLLASGGYDNRTLAFTWSAVQSLEENSSTVTWSLKGIGGKQTYYYALRNAQVKINGEVEYQQPYGGRIELRIGTLVASGTTVIKHNNEGVAQFTVHIQGGLYTGAINTTGDETFQLNDIPRKATITSAPNFTDESTPTVTYSNPLGSKASLRLGIYKPDGLTSIIGYREVSSTADSYTYQFSQSELNTLYRLIPNANSQKVRFYLETTVGSEVYLSHAERTFSIANGSPTLNPSVEDINSTTVALTGNSGSLIPGFSQAKCVFNTHAIKGATLKSQYVRNGENGTTSADPVFVATSDPNFFFAVRDSRDNTTTVTLTPNIVPYFPATCSLGDSAPSATGELNLSVIGKAFNKSFGAVQNTLTVEYRYKEDKAKDWGAWTPVSNLSWSADGNYHSTTSISGLNYQLTYVVQARATDKLTSVTTSERKIKTAPVFDWSKDDVSFNVPVKFNAGATGMFQTGSWTPTSPYVSFTKAIGQYTVVGKTCIINWFATGRVTTSTQLFYIEGIPVAGSSKYPWQAGGGNITNATVPAGQSFCGYNIEGTAHIYARSSGTSSRAVQGAYCGVEKGATLFTSGCISYAID